MSETDIWPFERGIVIQFDTFMQMGLYAKVESHVGQEAVKWRHPDSVVHTLSAVEGRLFLEGVVSEDRYEVVDDSFDSWETDMGGSV